MERLQVTVTQRFRSEMAHLMSLIEDTQPQFVRCIKSNNAQMPDEFQAVSVMQQLVNAGVIAALDMRRAGYPAR